jgi:surface protein
MKICPRFPVLLAALSLAGQANVQAEANATVSGTINYTGPVTGPVVVWAKFNDQIVNTVTLPNGSGPYTMQLPMNRNYDIKAFRDGNGNGNLDVGWQVGEPYAHHGDWNSTSSSFNTFLLDGNKTGIDVNIYWHNDTDNDGFYDWDEYVAGSEGNDSSSVPGIGYGLIAHWTFDETNGTILGGSSVNEINGTLVGFGSNSNAHWVPGKTGGALRFDGVDDYVSFPGATPLDDVRPFSFAGWIKLDQNGSGYVIAKRSLGSGYWRFFASNSTQNWLIRQTTGTTPSLSTTEVTPFFQWQHVALTWNGLLGGQNSKMYLDGTLVSNVTQNSGSGELTSDVGNLFTLGNRPQNNSSFFKGWMDDFRIWNRVLLPHEVNTLYESPSFPLTDANFTQAIDLWFSDQASAAATYGHIRDWNVTGVTDMSNAFKDRTTFNEDISGWDVGNVMNMAYMFKNASAFNQPIGDWNTSAVTNMGYLFYGSTAFNQDIGDWNMSAVTNMNNMFQNAAAFNQDIGNWNISSVTSMVGVFNIAVSFNQDIGEWDTSAVTNMWAMFQHANSFNQDISKWDVSNVSHMHYMFKGATSFSQDISDWNTSAAVNMTEMFENTPSLSNANKDKIHSSFSTNPNWPYDWSAFITPPPPNQTTPPPDNNGTSPPPENNQTRTDQNATGPAPGDPVVTLYRPLPKTLAHEELENGKIRLWGMILANGGSPITEAAFELADNMLFRNSTLHPASLFPGSPNFYLELKLEPGKRYYYRALATNKVGTTAGSTKKLTTSGDGIHWWSDTVLTQGGWRTSPWFGTFRRYEGAEWIYHAQLGWAYAHPDGSGGLWLWFRDHHWLWTQPGVYPYLWNHDIGGWLYLLGSQNGTPSFYHYESGSIR